MFPPGLRSCSAAHHLTTAVPDGPVWLNADPLRLEQVFVKPDVSDKIRRAPLLQQRRS